MAHSHLSCVRRRAFEQQRGFCHYCGLPMWEAEEAAFAARFGLSARLTRLLRSTAEHLVARCDGGRDERANIVAACHWCNRGRHRGRPHTAPPADAYLQHVTRRMASGRWHPANMAFRSFDQEDVKTLRLSLSLREEIIQTEKKYARFEKTEEIFMKSPQP